MLYGHICFHKDILYKDISEDVEKRYDTSNYEVNNSLPIEKLPV